MSVVQFPVEEEPVLCFCCDCGCTTFRVLSTRMLECSLCNAMLEDEVTTVSHERATYDGTKEVSSNSDMVTVDFAFQRTLSKASTGDSAAVVVMNKNGSTYVWSMGVEGDEEEAWFQERLDGLMEQLK